MQALFFVQAPYELFLSRQVEIMAELESNVERSAKFEECFKEFEQQKICYLPFTAFLLKPSQRLLHYEFMMKKLLQFYPPEHRDYAECKMAMEYLTPLIQLTNSSLVQMVRSMSHHFDEISDVPIGPFSV